MSITVTIDGSKHIEYYIASSIDLCQSFIEIALSVVLLPVHYSQFTRRVISDIDASNIVFGKIREDTVNTIKVN